MIGPRDEVKVFANPAFYPDPPLIAGRVWPRVDASEGLARVFYQKY